MILTLSMRRWSPYLSIARERATQGAALGGLLLIGWLAVAGPSGILAWSENRRLLDQRHAQIAALETRRDALANRNQLLDPDHADPDLVGELLRRQFGVAHPDEVVVALD